MGCSQIATSVLPSPEAMLDQASCADGYVCSLPRLLLMRCQDLKLIRMTHALPDHAVAFVVHSPCCLYASKSWNLQKAAHALLRWAPNSRTELCFHLFAVLKTKVYVALNCWCCLSNQSIKQCFIYLQQCQLPFLSQASATDFANPASCSVISCRALLFHEVTCSSCKIWFCPSGLKFGFLWH